MSDDIFNQVAALMSGGLSEQETADLVLTLSKDPDAIDLLAKMGLPQFAHLPDTDLPFEVVGQFRAGIWGRHLRMLQLSGLQLGSEASRIADCISQITRERIPACFRKSVDLKFDLGALLGSLIVSAEEETNCWSIRVLSENDTSKKAQIEVWDNGMLLRRAPISRLERNPFSELKPGASIGLRVADETTGIEIQLVPVEFSLRDWIGVCLSCALEGWIGEAITILRNRISRKLGDPVRTERLTSFMEVLGSIAKMDNLILVPASLTRAGVEEEAERRLRMFQSVWRGILEVWPQSRFLQTPWNTNEFDPEDLSGLPEGAHHLLRVTIDATKEFPDPESLKSESSDPFVQSGFAALRGLTYLLTREYEEAREAFLSVDPADSDPFLLRSGAQLAEHFVFNKDMKAPEDSIRTSSNTVWRASFDEIVKPLE